MSLPMFSKVVLLLFHVVVANSLYSSQQQQQQQQQPSCHDEELSALLQFKKSFIITKSASGYNGSYPKVSSWKPAEGANNTSCCSWEGVECDVQTGHVIGLDLSSSCLYGSINSNSSLFLLVHLQRLNLADNHFNYSQIPTRISNLQRLISTFLPLFSGHVPSKVSQLSILSSLDLSLNLDGFSGEKLLKMNASNMRSLVQNLTSLEKLSLNFINISSAVPDSIANLSFFTSLTLRDCGIFGQFPAGVFKLPNLKILSLRFNQYLTGNLPEFNQSSPLMVLKIAGTSFSGKLPSSIENLGSLNELDVGSCSFSGMVPFSLGNLRQLNYVDLSFNKFNGPIPTSLANLTELTYLSLSYNNFSGGALSWLAKQTKLTDLYLRSINLIGDIPSSLRNLTQLTRLNLPKNHLTGPIPSWLGYLTKLVDIYHSQNKLHGSFPESIYNVMNLRNLLLDENNLSGIVEFDKLLNLQNLIQVYLSNNKFELRTESQIMNASLPQFRVLGLGSCNLSEFPYFLRYQERLEWLDLHGQVPKWMLNTSTETLQILALSFNHLSGFDHPPVVLPWVNMRSLTFAMNLVQGPLLIPPPYTEIYQVSGNKLSGEISPLICNMSFLVYLDLSNNKLSGMLPQWLMVRPLASPPSLNKINL